MLTLFTVPKTFAGHADLIQRNAIGSWTRLVPACEIILFGQESEVAPVARALGVRWCDQLRYNRFGTPLLDSVFAAAAQQARHALLAYANADILLLPDFLAAVQRLSWKRFLVVSQRWDLRVTRPLAFDRQAWPQALLRDVRRRGRLHRPAGSDVFVFPRGLGLEALPPFAVGRQGWDNWLIARARQLAIPVIDVTFCTTVIHQDHDYAHVPHGNGSSYHGIESEENAVLYEPDLMPCNLSSVTHLLLPAGLCRRPRRKTTLKHLRSLHGRRRLFGSWGKTPWGRVWEYLTAYRHCPPMHS